MVTFHSQSEAGMISVLLWDTAVSQEVNLMQPETKDTKKGNPFNNIRLLTEELQCWRDDRVYDSISDCWNRHVKRAEWLRIGTCLQWKGARRKHELRCILIFLGFINLNKAKASVNFMLYRPTGQSRYLPISSWSTQLHINE